MYNNNAVNNVINNQHYLMLCELHYPRRHCKTEDSDPNIETHYLVYDRFDSKTGISYSHLNEYDTDYDYDTDSEDEYNSNIFVKLNTEVKWLQEHYSTLCNTLYSENHPTIRNYHNIIKHSNYIKLEIGQYIILPTQEAIAILKTFWLRIIQKKWKKVYQEQKNIIKKRCNLLNLTKKEFSMNLINLYKNLPGLKGMLSGLKNNLKSAV
jgi:hypothetical protein